MTLVLQSIADLGDLQKERVVLRAAEDADMGEYALFRCWKSVDGKALSGNVPRAFWFADKPLKKGDFVVLYSKEGKASEKASSNNTSYFYYWGATTCLWGNEYIPVLLRPINWTTLKSL